MRLIVSFFLGVCFLLPGACAQAQLVKPYLRIETVAHAAAVNRIDVDAAEQFLVSASIDKTARVWDLRSGTLLKILRPPIGDGEEGMLYAIASSPDGATLAVGGFTGVAGSGSYPVYIFDRESGAIRKTIPGLPGRTRHLAYSKDGRYLAAGLGSNGIRIFEAAGYSEVARDAEYGDNCYGLEFDASGRLVTASLDGFVRLYSRDFHRLHKESPPDGKQPLSVRFSPDGKLIAVGLLDSTAVDVLSAEDLSFQYKLQPPLSGVDLSTALWSADGTTLCAAGRYRTADAVYPVLCWSNRGKGKLSTFSVVGEAIMDMRALHDGAIAFCSAAGTVGVLGASAARQWRAAPDLLGYHGAPSFLGLSSDGDSVQVASSYFTGATSTRDNISLSVSELRFQIDTDSKPPLPAPATTGLAIDRWEDDEHPTLDGRALPLEAYESSRSLAISPNNDSFILGTDWYLRKFDRQGKQIWSTLVPGVAWGVNISADGRFAVAALGDGTVRWYTFDKGEEVMAFFVDRDLHRWAAWNPDGFFATQGGGDALIGYQINRGPDHAGEFVKMEQLREVFYRPDLIAQILKTGGAEAVLAARKRVGDISQVLSGGFPPEIELISPAQTTVPNDYLLQFRIKDMGGGQGRIVYRIDGVEIEGGTAADVAATGNNIVSRHIPLASGAHTLTVTAYNASGKIEGRPKTIQITSSLPVAGPNLWVIAAGISHYSDHSLWEGVKFAAADADQVAARFKEQEGKGLYRQVNAVSLPDGQATTKNIQNAVAQVAKTVQPGDTFVLYLAGHGEAVNGEYYFIPWEAESTNHEELLNKSLNRNAIQALLRQVPANQGVLILDTCGLGVLPEARATASEKAALEKIALMSGRTILAASNSEGMAMDGYQNHGVFTFALLEGLQQAESNARGEILITRLAEFVQNQVPAITEEKWHYRQLPLSKIEGEPFPIARKPANSAIADCRCREPKNVILIPQAREKDLFFLAPREEAGSNCYRIGIMNGIMEAETEKYLYSLLPRRDAVLREMERYAARHDVPIIGPACGRVLYQLATLVGARRVFEMGSAIGYSTLWLARAVGPKGVVYYTDGNPANARRAEGYLNKAGVRGRVRILVGDARTLLKSTKGQFDLIFNDVDKTQYPDVFRYAADRVRVGGLLIADNVLWHGRACRPASPGDAQTRAIREFNRLIYRSPKLFTTIIPLRDGLAVCRRMQ